VHETSSVRLRLTLATKARLTLGVYSVDGRLQRQLLAAVPTEVGSHSFAWDLKDDRGRGVPGGVYFIRAAQESDGSAATWFASRVVVVR
jgi:flagellar hook assembly protein FlgD